jgi:hypothetical protein
MLIDCSIGHLSVSSMRHAEHLLSNQQWHLSKALQIYCQDIPALRDHSDTLSTNLDEACWSTSKSTHDKTLDQLRI